MKPQQIGSRSPPSSTAGYLYKRRRRKNQRRFQTSLCACGEQPKSSTNARKRNLRPHIQILSSCRPQRHGMAPLISFVSSRFTRFAQAWRPRCCRRACPPSPTPHAASWSLPQPPPVLLLAPSLDAFVPPNSKVVRCSRQMLIRTIRRSTATSSPTAASIAASGRRRSERWSRSSYKPYRYKASSYFLPQLASCLSCCSASYSSN
jgi:hypothetical protein